MPGKLIKSGPMVSSLRSRNTASIFINFCNYILYKQYTGHRFNVINTFLSKWIGCVKFLGSVHSRKLLFTKLFHIYLEVAWNIIHKIIKIEYFFVTGSKTETSGRVSNRTDDCIHIYLLHPVHNIGRFSTFDNVSSVDFFFYVQIKF